MLAADAFHHAILDQPDADAPRLVFADWLEERGDPLAELIRLQCELARTGTIDRRHERLAAREQELRTAHEADWFVPLRELGVAGRFQRGLLEVSVSGIRAFLNLADDLFRLPWVLHSRLSDASATHDDLAALAASPHFVRLQRLDLSRSPVGNDGLRLLCGSRYRCRLTHLTLKHNQVSSRGLRQLLETLDVRRLTELHLYGNGIGAEGARALSGSPWLGRLRKLDLSYNNLRTVGGEYLAESHFLNQLKDLFVRGNSIGPRGKKALRMKYGPRVHLGNAGSPF